MKINRLLALIVVAVICLYCLHNFGRSTTDLVKQELLSTLHSDYPAGNANNTADVIKKSTVEEKELEFKPCLKQSEFIKLPEPSLCNSGLTAVILVKSATSHSKQRQIIRETWASPAQDEDAMIRVLFLLGKPSTNVTVEETQLAKEAKRHKDLIQGSFIDVYKNLTKKAIMGMRWVSEYCRSASLILSVDDDTYVDLNSLTKFHSNLEDEMKGIMRCGRKLAKHARISRKGKWAVPVQVLNVSYYPPYCTGDCYIMSNDVVTKLYSASCKTSLGLSIDDVLITGIIREKAKVKIEKIEKNICFYLDNGKGNIERKLIDEWKLRNQIPLSDHL